MLRKSWVAGLLAGCMAAVPSPAAGQFRAPPPPAAYALENVTIVHADGRTEAGVNVVIRNGLIEALGADVRIPADAEILEGDSLFVYPGFVDGVGQAEVAFPEIERPDDMRSWDATRSVQGFMPHRRVVDHLAATGESGAAQRTKGIVAAGVHASGGLASGVGAVVLFRKDAKTPWDLVLKDDLGLSMAFQPAQGAYPSQLFGIIAYMRQAFEDANRDALVQAAYKDDPEGMTAPRWDPDYEVLRSAVAGELTVYFAADRAEDIRRVLMLSSEYGFHPVIVGGMEAWKVAEELASRGVPVLVDGDYPKPKEWKPDAEEPPEGEEAAPEDEPEVAEQPTEQEAQEQEAPEQEAPEQEEPEEEAPEELEPAAAREKERIENAYANAGRLAAAGVTFAITSGGGDADLREAARKAIEYGLSEDDALRAITTTPAELLGIPRVPVIGQGLSATFVVIDGPVFEEGTNIAFTLVEGEVEEGKPASGGGGTPAVDVAGSWTMTVNAQGQEIVFELTLEQSPDGSVSGTAVSAETGEATVSGSVSGNALSFTLHIDAGGQQLEVEVEGVVEGDRMSGSGDSPFGAFEFTAVKNPGGVR